MSNFIRLESSTNFIFVTVLSCALLVAGTQIVLSDDAPIDSSTPASIVVVKPNGGQVVAPQSHYTIRWIAQGVDTVRIEYSPDGGRTWLLINDEVPAVTEQNFHCPETLLKQFLPEDVTNNMGSYVWNVPNIESGDALIRILDKFRPSVSDVTDQPFAIAQRDTVGWTVQSVGASVTLFSVSIVDDNITWTSGLNGVVFRTTNGGSNWTQAASLPTDATSIFGLNVDTAFVCANFTNDGRLYRTTNGGISWTLVYQYGGSGAAVVSVHMFDHTRGVALGNPVGGYWRVLGTTNGGLTWNTIAQVLQYQNEIGARQAFRWVSDQNGWFGSDYGRVYRTTNGGLAWTVTTVAGLDIVALSFPTDQIGIASVFFRSIYKTTDGGVSWSYVSTVPAPHPMVPVSFIAGSAVPGLRWWATSLDEIYRSTDHGLTWTYETVLDGFPINDISMKYIQERNVLIGYAVGAAGGALMRYRETITSVPDEDKGTLPLTLELFQNYPNPFNPTTVIRYSLPVGRDAIPNYMVTLRVYNLLGQEVATLVNEVKQPGRYSVVFDAGNLPSGVYCYRLRAGGFLATKKMILIR